MDFKVTLIVSEAGLGPLMAAVMKVETNIIDGPHIEPVKEREQPLADDTLRGLIHGAKQAGPVKRLAKKARKQRRPSKLPGEGTIASQIYHFVIDGERKRFRDVSAKLRELGASPKGAGSLLQKLLRQGLIVKAGHGLAVSYSAPPVVTRE